ncbi:MAG: DUF3800 domain-containing protein [Verrucomicrobiaceae bacterium]|nr:DUF3800 domain-containing protein [Verrucomicrobiaceae bacterium]
MNSPPAIPFGDYLVFVDESGDHSLTSINPQHPVFVLAFVIIKKTDYVRQVCPAFQEFKMRYWGHDEVVLHEHEIRKPQDAFSFLQIKPLREKFMRELTVIMEELPATVVAVVIDKTAFLSAHASPEGVYDYAMEIGINAVFSFLQRHDNSDTKTPVVVECRGRKEDKELELAFRRFCDSGKGHNRPLPFDLVMIPKTSNSAGLQLADLVARPIGIKHIRPQQPNRAYDIIQAKLDRVGNDEPEGYGLITIP